MFATALGDFIFSLPALAAETRAWNRRCPLCGNEPAREELYQKEGLTCHHQASFLHSITPETVLEAIEQIL